MVSIEALTPRIYIRRNCFGPKYGSRSIHRNHVWSNDDGSQDQSKKAKTKVKSTKAEANILLDYTVGHTEYGFLLRVGSHKWFLQAHRDDGRGSGRIDWFRAAHGVMSSVVYIRVY